MKYRVVATFVFEDIEADNPEQAQEMVDLCSFCLYISHPQSLRHTDPIYEVDEMGDE